MKKALLKFLQYYKYPQFTFAKDIANQIIALSKPKVIFDLPCGQGLTSKILANKTKAKIIAADISSESIGYALEHFSDANITFTQGDIHEVLKLENSLECICIINSLFLLPDQDGLLKLIHSKLTADGLFILIVPNTQSANFEIFQKIDPNLNTLIIHPHDFSSFFQKYNFKVIKTQGCTYAPFWNRSILKYLWIFGDFYLHLESFFSKKLGKQPQYFLLVLKHETR